MTAELTLYYRSDAAINLAIFGGGDSGPQGRCTNNVAVPEVTRLIGGGHAGKSVRWVLRLKIAPRQIF